MAGSSWLRGAAPWLLMLGVASLTACGGGGGGSDDGGSGAGSGGNGGGGDNGGSPVEPEGVPGLNANGDIVDGQGTSIYANPDDSQVIRINLTVKAADPDGACRGEDDPAGPEDYSGCTLEDMIGDYDDPNDRGDNDSKDGFDPELFATAEIPSEGLTFNSEELEIRGATSRLSKQKSFKVEFEDAAGVFAGDWYGMERFQLNKHPYDLSRIRNKLSFDLFKEIDDFPSLRSQFVHVFVTDKNAPERGEQDFGLFTNIEYMDEVWAKNHGQDENANIFKAEQFEFLSPTQTPAVTADADSDEFETVLESKGDNEDTTVLLEMLTALGDEQVDFTQTFNRYFHPDNFRTWLAINILMSNSDSNSQNFYLYRPAEIDNFYFTPWDYDGAWDYYGQPVETSMRPRWEQGVANWWNMTLVRRYIQSGAGNVQALTDKVNELYAGPLNPDNVRRLIDSYPAQVDEIATSSPDVDGLPTVPGTGETAAQQRQTEIDRLPGTVTDARDTYKKTLNRPMPMYLEVLVNDGNVTLQWDESYDIQGDALVYDVRLATAPALNDTLSACRADDDAMPVLEAANVVFGADSVTGTNVIPSPALTPETDYYFQVVARDDEGYCQSAFDSYYDADNDRVYQGVLGFRYQADGTVVLISD